MTAPSERPAVVYGVDPEPGSSRLGLAWAADEAQYRRLALRLVLAEGRPTIRVTEARQLPSWEEWNRALHRTGEEVLAAALSFVLQRHPDLEVTTLLAEGEPAWVLREQSRQAAVVVVGSRRLTARQELFTSASVALPLIAHARCPVVVVREPEHAGLKHPCFLVGVDGSRAAQAAIDTAFEEAALRGAGLRALHVWHPPLLGQLDEHAAQQEARRLLAEAVAGRAADYPQVELHHEVVRGHPVEVLAGESAHALGVVVGTRGRGGFTGMLLGSVGQGLLHHARCPLITVAARQ